jgi:hypothetical protein
LWSGDLKGRGRLEDVDVRIILKWVLRIHDGKEWLELIRTGTSGELL